jgi:hypothetical protein
MKVFALLSTMAISLLSVAYPQELPKGKSDGDWSNRSALPLISVKAISPIKDQSSFTNEFGYLRYSIGVKKESGQSTFATDGEAVASAKSFIKEYFGELPFDLRASRIDHSASGRATPQSADDSGFTIVFDSLYHGIVIANRGAVVYIHNKTIIMASIHFVNPSPIPNSEHTLIDKKRALSVLAQMAKELSGEKSIPPVPLVLHYVWSPEDNRIMDSKESIMRPNWSIGDGDGMYIDAFTGRLWRND